MLEFIIIVESEADFRTASELANRVLTDEIEWLADYLDSTFQWRGLQDGTDFSCWRDVNKIIKDAQSQGIRLPRFLRRSQPLKSDGAAALKILQLTAQLQKQQKRTIKAVIFVRDLDSQPSRRTGLEQAHTEFAQRLPSSTVVIGTADTKREAWVLNGFCAAR